MQLQLLEVLLQNLPIAALVGITAGLLRSIAGWLENVLKDGKVDKFEWKQLLGTITKYFGGMILLMFGLPIGTSIVALFGLDVITSSLKKK